MIMIIIILRNSNRNFLFSSSLKRKDSGALYSNFKPILVAELNNGILEHYQVF